MGLPGTSMTICRCPYASAPWSMSRTVAEVRWSQQPDLPIGIGLVRATQPAAVPLPLPQTLSGPAWPGWA